MVPDSDDDTTANTTNSRNEQCILHLRRDVEYGKSCGNLKTVRVVVVSHSGEITVVSHMLGYVIVHPRTVCPDNGNPFVIVCNVRLSTVNVQLTLHRKMVRA